MSDENKSYYVIEKMAITTYNQLRKPINSAASIWIQGTGTTANTGELNNMTKPKELPPVADELNSEFQFLYDHASINTSGLFFIFLTMCWIYTYLIQAQSQ
jgi:hypothetical protein